MHWSRFWGKREVLDFMDFICEEIKKKESFISAFKMTSFQKSEECGRLCRWHWP